MLAPSASGGRVQVETLSIEELSLIAQIDRAEHVDVEYAVRGGRLIERPVMMAEIPAWDPTGVGPHSVAAAIDFCRRAIEGGGVLVGCFDEQQVMGVAVVDPSFEGPLAWLAFLHVSRPHRRRGAASALWNRAVLLAGAAGAERLYVSATPTGSAVGFYVRQGCLLADPVHPTLYADEPDDVHLVLRLG
jgi:predicted N-acetyltransferase YhbS